MLRMSEPELDLSTEDFSSAHGEARLVEAARQGDQAAFGELVVRYERRLISVIMRFVPDVELARDLAQETFIQIYRRLDQFDTSRRFGPWLFRSGVNHTLDFLRKRKRRLWFSLYSDNPAEKPPDPPQADPREARDLEQEVRRVLELIPEKYRTVLILRDLENFSTAEISAIVQRKEATIRWRLAEARERFQRIWLRRQSGIQTSPQDEESDDPDDL